MGMDVNPLTRHGGLLCSLASVPSTLGIKLSIVNLCTSVACRIASDITASGQIGYRPEIDRSVE